LPFSETTRLLQKQVTLRVNNEGEQARLPRCQKKVQQYQKEEICTALQKLRSGSKNRETKIDCHAESVSSQKRLQSLAGKDVSDWPKIDPDART
jgi:hypothetical protein